jgi:hypothetical protein
LVNTTLNISELILRQDTIGEAEVPWLQAQIEKYPWCSSYHILLAKAYFNEDSFLKSKHLRMAAMYAGNREALFNFLNNEIKVETEIGAVLNEEPEEIEQVVSNKQSEVESLTFSEAIEDDEVAETFSKEENAELQSEELQLQEENELQTEVKVELEEKSITDENETALTEKEPENLVLKDTVLEAEEPEVVEAIDKETSIPKLEMPNLDDLAKTAAELEIKLIAKDHVEKPAKKAINFDEIVVYDPLKELKPRQLEKKPIRAELPLDMVRYNPLLELEKIAKEREAAEKSGEKDFLYWLNHIDDKKDETVNDKPNSPDKVQSLLDQFLATKRQRPIINRSFYNAESKAVESETDNLDVISETLVALYAKQGMFEKAILGYEKLSLQIPDKSAYFAARISEIKEKQQSI